MAVLEMVKSGELDISQDKSFAPIIVNRLKQGEQEYAHR
jgi:chromatin segregation and condensation protein Rec8/ScpA/Scc1 (kleisin family)